MRHDWIIDVLADLRGAARREGLDRLAEQIDDTLIVAAGEIAAKGEAAANCPPALFRAAAPQHARRH